MSTTKGLTPEFRYQVRVESHLKNTSEKLFKLYKDGDFCDCTLTSGKTVINVHRNILATVEYFHSMFSRGWSETISASADMTKTIPEEILSAFVEFLYLGTVELKSIEQVLQMFFVADKFFMQVRALEYLIII